MASPTTDGRMIRKAISKSVGFASLSPEAQLLFVMLIPHFNSFGKMNGSPYFVKGEVVPLLNQYGTSIIESCLAEISSKTNVKWFESKGLMYLHSTSWSVHQKLRGDKLGSDSLPSFCTTPELVRDLSGSSPNEVRHEVEVEVEGKDKTFSSSSDEVGSDGSVFFTKKKRKLSGKRLESFLLFWDAFDYKSGKAEAADAWLDIPVLNQTLVSEIIKSATLEAGRRKQLIEDGKTPKMAQGWLSARRWEDEILSGAAKPGPFTGTVIAGDVPVLSPERIAANRRALEAVECK